MNVSFKREPVAWVFAIKACLVVAISYGLKMTNEQLALVVVALEAIGGLIVRQNVYAPTDAQGQPVMAVTSAQHALITAQNAAADTGNLTGTAPAPQIIHTESEMPHPKKNGLTQDELIHLMHEREKWMKEGEPHGEGQAKVP